MSMPHATKKNATCLGDLSSSPSALEQFSETCDSLTAQRTPPHPSKPPSQLFHRVASMHKSQVQPGQPGSADHWSIASNIGSPDSVRAGGRAVRGCEGARLVGGLAGRLCEGVRVSGWWEGWQEGCVRVWGWCISDVCIVWKSAQY